ncbi:hypothetical protein ACP6JB_003012 [Aspergillus fumigatus]
MYQLGPWSALEYGCIARESYAAGARFLLSSVPTSLQLPNDLAATQGLEVEHRSVEEIFADRKSKVCLLDPAAQVELSPEDGDIFDVFLFGGILVPLEKIEYVDDPEIIVNKHERIEMPFRYVKGDDGQPIMPAGMVDLIKKDADKAVDDLF